MNEPTVIQPLIMRSIGDCAICCLSMICERSYLDVMRAIPKKLRGTCMSDGLTVSQVCRVAKRLGAVLDYYESPDDDIENEWEAGDALGLLHLERRENDDGHMVVYLKGVLYNPADGEIWTDVDAFCQRGRWEVQGFLWRKS